VHSELRQQKLLQVQKKKEAMDMRRRMAKEKADADLLKSQMSLRKATRLKRKQGRSQKGKVRKDVSTRS